ncbi:MAG: TolC family protein [Candidatus Gastranaerophilales bacterium]|nr:TolC family protein [Candidatus Gastranaerophilales bacterium]
MKNKILIILLIMTMAATQAAFIGKAQSIEETGNMQMKPAPSKKEIKALEKKLKAEEKAEKERIKCAKKQEKKVEQDVKMTQTHFVDKKQAEQFGNVVDNVIKQENISPTKSDAKVVEGYVQETFILSLDDCIAKALQTNPIIRSAFSNSEIDKTKIGQAWSKYLPTFSMTNGATRNRFLTINFPVPQQYYTFYNAIDASTTQLIFDFGKTKAKADASKKVYEASVATLNETINNTIYNVKEAYYQLLYSMEKQNVYLDAIDAYSLQYKQASAFYTIGTKPKIDVVNAEYNLGNARLGYIKASNETQIAYAKLNNAMGIPKEVDYKLLDKLKVQDYVCDFDFLARAAFESRPELESFRKKALASKLNVRYSKRAFYPDIEFVGQIQAGGGTSFTDDYGFKVGAQMAYKTTNFYLLKKQVDEAKATYQRDLADLAVEENDLYLEVREAYINLKNAKESVPVSALAVKKAEEQYKLASGRYKAGVGDAIEFKDAENTYRSARLDYLNALVNYNVSAASLEKVIGSKLVAK